MFSLGWLIHAGPGRASLLGSVVLVKRLGCFRPCRDEGFGALLGDAGGKLVMDVRGRIEADPGMLVMMVIPIHKLTDEGAGIAKGSEAFGTWARISWS